MIKKCVYHMLLWSNGNYNHLHNCQHHHRCYLPMIHLIFHLMLYPKKHPLLYLTYFLLDYPSWSDIPSHIPFANSALKTIVDLWVSNNPVTMAEHGPIRQWDLLSTSLSLLFYEIGSFNYEKSLWDASSVTDMRDMLYYATSFNSYLSWWDVG